MLKMIYEYKKALRAAKKMYEPYTKIDPQLITPQEDTEKKIISSMIRDLEFAIKWMETGRNPNLKRGIDRHGVYTMDPQLLDKLKIDKFTPDERELTQEEREKVEDALCALTKREREVFMMVRVEMLTYEYTAELLGIKKTSVQNHLKRAERKIERRKRESLFLVS